MAGTLSYALAYANAQSSPVTVNIETNVTLSGALSPILNSLTINGNGHRVFAVSGGVTACIATGASCFIWFPASNAQKRCRTP